MGANASASSSSSSVFFRFSFAMRFISSSVGRDFGMGEMNTFGIGRVDLNSRWSWETYGIWIESDFLQTINMEHDAAIGLETFSYHPSKRYPSKARLDPIYN